MELPVRTPNLLLCLTLRSGTDGARRHGSLRSRRLQEVGHPDLHHSAHASLARQTVSTNSPDDGGATGCDEAAACRLKRTCVTGLESGVAAMTACSKGTPLIPWITVAGVAEWQTRPA